MTYQIHVQSANRLRNEVSLGHCIMQAIEHMAVTESMIKKSKLYVKVATWQFQRMMRGSQFSSEDTDLFQLHDQCDKLGQMRFKGRTLYSPQGLSATKRQENKNNKYNLRNSQLYIPRVKQRDAVKYWCAQTPTPMFEAKQDKFAWYGRDQKPISENQWKDLQRSSVLPAKHNWSQLDEIREKIPKCRIAHRRPF